MSYAEESQFISQFLAAYSGLATKYPADFVPPGLAPNWTSKRATFERPAKHVKAGAVEGDIQVIIKSLKSGQWTVDVSAQGTITDLKKALEAKAGIEVASQRLVLKGKALVDSKRLEDYGLASGAVIHLFSKAGTVASTPAVASNAHGSLNTAGAQESEGTGTSGGVVTETSGAASAATASVSKKPAVTSYRGLSEAGTVIAKEAEFWHWLNDQLTERLGSKEDASLMVKGFLGQYRDLVGNADTKQIENEIRK